jgi:LmbE family N-acetylglucosaminyl deacetylase
MRGHVIRRVLNLGFMRRWTHWHTLVAVVLLGLYAASAINGWGWSLRGRTQIEGLLAAYAQLDEAVLPEGSLMIIAPHPDDETLATGGIIAEAVRDGREVRVVFVTLGDAFIWSPLHSLGGYLHDGKGYRELGEIRMQEALEATRILGVPDGNVIFLGFPDGGLIKLLTENYLMRYQSPTTRATTVPYANTYRLEAPYTGYALERLLEDILQTFKPDIVIGPGLTDRHPDHAATAFFIARLSVFLPDTQFYYNLVHGGLEWPLPKGLHPQLPLVPIEPYSTQAWHAYPLSEEARELKLEALLAYRTQMRVMGRYLLAFVRENEILLEAPPAPTP